MVKSFMPEKPAVLVRANAVERTYRIGQGRTVALKPTTFTIVQGDRIALVGPSGSGKSTLLGLIAGLDRPDYGGIEWPDLPLRGGRPLDVAVAFQAPSLVSFLSVLENVALPALITGAAQTEADARAREALAFFHLDDLASKLPDEISGGQAQRVQLARAIAAGPRLLLADEPTGQLDHGIGLATVDIVLDWCERHGCALVIATHDRLIAARFDVVWNLDHGQLSIPGSLPAMGSAA
jgi:ABC-type lipoprotein export system ATPase subunit